MIVTSNSKRSRDDKTKFSEAEKNWNLEKLYEDLKAAKQRCASARTKILTETEKCYLRGLLCGRSDKVIANERGVVVGTVNDALSKTLYCYIEELLDYNKKIRHWSNVPDFLEQAGYKIQVSEEFQPSHPLPDEKENILEASHKIGTTSFLEYFSKSIDQLKSKDRHVRIGAISTLGTIAKYSQPAEHWTIMEYLAAFVRTNASRKEDGEEKRSPKISEVIQAALTVIVQRDWKKDPENQRLNLSNTDIRGAVLAGANLQGAILSKANLQGTYLKDANLQEVNFNGANLQETDLFKANLKWSKLKGANLKRASFVLANLQEAYLFGANLERACLWSANLQGANLFETNLEEAHLSGANLQGTQLSEVNMGGARLTQVKLQGADLSRVKNLETQQLEVTYGDSQTASSLPENIKAPKHWMRSK
jgi:hypothetical protein